MFYCLKGVSFKCYAVCVFIRYYVPCRHVISGILSCKSDLISSTVPLNDVSFGFTIIFLSFLVIGGFFSLSMAGFLPTKGGRGGVASTTISCFNTWYLLCCEMGCAWLSKRGILFLSTLPVQYSGYSGWSGYCFCRCLYLFCEPDADCITFEAMFCVSDR